MKKTLLKTIKMKNDFCNSINIYKIETEEGVYIRSVFYVEKYGYILPVAVQSNSIIDGEIIYHFMFNDLYINDILFESDIKKLMYEFYDYTETDNYIKTQKILKEEIIKAA